MTLNPATGVSRQAEIPAAGGIPYEVLPGIFRVSLPLLSPLKEVNAWIVEDGPGWTIVDCGDGRQATLDLWDALLASAMFSGRPVRRIIVTHAHGDHVGMASGLAKRTGATLCMSQDASNAARRRARPIPPDEHGQATRFLISHGCSPERAALLAARRSVLSNPPPDDFEVLKAGSSLSMGGREWTVSIFGGHAPGQAVLCCGAQDVLFTGDVLLPRITPFVGVDWTEPDADPLADHLAAQQAFKSFPAQTIALPGHGAPFADPGGRATEIAEHHYARLSGVQTMLVRPASAFEIAGRVFPRAIDGAHGHLAFAEALAHLNRLTAQNRIQRKKDTGGRIVFVALPQSAQSAPSIPNRGRGTSR